MFRIFVIKIRANFKGKRVKYFSVFFLLSKTEHISKGYRVKLFFLNFCYQKPSRFLRVTLWKIFFRNFVIKIRANFKGKRVKYFSGFFLSKTEHISYRYRVKLFFLNFCYQKRSRFLRVTLWNIFLYFLLSKTEHIYKGNMVKLFFLNFCYQKPSRFVGVMESKYFF